MLVLNDDKVREQFTGFVKGNSAFAQCEDNDVFFIHPEANCIDLEYPALGYRITYFASCLATLGRESAHFDGALLWITLWGVWGPQDEGIGYRITEAMHRAAGQPISFESGRGHLFRADEINEAIAMMLQPMIFSWDAYYLPRWSWGEGDPFFLYISHDSFVTVVTRTKEFYDQVFAELEKAGLNPKPGHERHLTRFCRTP